MAYLVMAYVVMADIAMAYIPMAYGSAVPDHANWQGHIQVWPDIAMADIVTAYIGMACIVIAYVVMADIVMAYIVMACGSVVPEHASWQGPIKLWPYIVMVRSCELKRSYKVMALYSYGPIMLAGKVLQSYGLYSYGPIMRAGKVLQSYGPI